jgi:succinate dehydrogenase cytochrome b556 subunit
MHRLSPEQRMLAYAELWPAHPRWGIWAWWAQRVSGVALIVYAAWHIIRVAGSAGHPERLAEMLQILRNPVVAGLLLAGTAYHSANGVRLVLFDLGVDSMRQRKAFWVFLAAAVLIALAGFSRVVL